jgi:hypothetical protein
MTLPPRIAAAFSANVMELLQRILAGFLGAETMARGTCGTGPAKPLNRSASDGEG